MTPGLVLSVFPGIDLLGRAFEEEGYCVVRGPDLLWGGNIRTFHPPAGVFEGVIGGPPCQAFSRLRHLARGQGHDVRFGNLIPEFDRCVAEAQPRWFVMENVVDAPLPSVLGYGQSGGVLNNRWFGGVQHRKRRITFGWRGEPAVSLRAYLEVVAFEAPEMMVSVTGGTGYSQREARAAKAGFPVTARHAGRVSWMPRSDTAGHGGNDRVYVYELEDACELQGLPRGFCEYMPFTKDGKLKAVANGVPLPMGRAIAQAVRRAMAATAQEVG